VDKIRVFYVEDEPFLGQIVRESLESRNFCVEMVTDGRVAADAFAKSEYDIVVLDIMLPHIDGLTLARTIRAHAPQIPIIFVTAKVQTEDVVKGFESGGNDYLRKPFSMEELIVRIHNLLHLTQKPVTLQAAVTLGRFVFDKNRHELRFGAAVRKLSHRESKLLETLAAKLNTQVERKEILLQVWGDDSFFNSRNLDVYISRLREYLRADPDIQIITLKGVGYQFVVPG